MSKRPKMEPAPEQGIDFFQNDVFAMQRHALNDANEMDLFESFSETMKNSDFTSLTNFNNSVAQNNKPIPTATMEQQKVQGQELLYHPPQSTMSSQGHGQGQYMTDPFAMVDNNPNMMTVKSELLNQNTSMTADAERLQWGFADNDDNFFNSIPDVIEDHKHGDSASAAAKPTKMAKDRRRERNKVLARKTRVKKKAELEILRDKMLSLVCESKRLKGVITANLPIPLAQRVFEQADSNLPENIMSIVQQVITRQEKSVFEDLKLQQRSFCIVNATVPDLPIIYASVDFCKLTGYPTDEIIGKNCRLLQGADTNKAETLKIRQALENGRDFISVLLNYKKDGTKFWNQIQMSHMKDINGLPSLILGIQSQVSPAFSPQGYTQLSGRASSGQIDRATANAIDAMLHERSLENEATGQNGPDKKGNIVLNNNGTASSSSAGTIPSSSSHAFINHLPTEIEDKKEPKSKERTGRPFKSPSGSYTTSYHGGSSPPTTESMKATAAFSSNHPNASRTSGIGSGKSFTGLGKEHATTLTKAPSLSRFLKEEQVEKNQLRDGCSSSGNGSGTDSLKQLSEGGTSVERGTSVTSDDSEKLSDKRGQSKFEFDSDLFFENVNGIDDDEVSCPL